MKSFLQEYGRMIVGALIGIVCLSVLFYSGAIMDAIDRIKPESPIVRNEVTKIKLTGLSQREKPRIVFRAPELKLGDRLPISEIILSAKDADGADIKEKIHYYLEDGTEVDKNYIIYGERLGILQYRFYVEDDQGIYINKKFALAISNIPSLPEGQKVEAEWDIGRVEGTVKASIISYQEDNKNTISQLRMVLMLSGEGTAKTYGKAADVPWYQTYSSQITECIINETVETPDISFWFKDCTKLERVPILNHIDRMESAFENCQSIKNAYIPPSASNIRKAYKNCMNLITANSIPATVIQMEEVFYGCVRFRGDLLIKADPPMYDRCFYKAASNSGGVTLRVYAGDEISASTVKEMVQREIMDMNGSNVTYLGIRKE